MPSTINVDVSRTIAASPEAIWEVLADLTRLPEWLEFAAAVEAVSGPAESGATYTVKPHKPYEPTTRWQVTEVEAPVRQLHTSEMPVVSGVRSELQLTRSSDGATVRVHWSGTPKGVMGRMMSAPMQKRITQNWQRSLEKLEAVVRAA